MVEELKHSKRFGLILMKGGREFPRHWEEHLNNLGYTVHRINERPRPLFDGELLNRWYPGIRRSLEGMAGKTSEISKLTGIPEKEISDIVSLKDKSSFTVDEERKFKRFVERLAEHKDEIKGLQDAHTLVTSYLYLNRPVQWVLLERNAGRDEITSKLGLDGNAAERMLKGHDSAPEQDFIKAFIVGATNMEKAHEGSLRKLAIGEISEKGITSTLQLDESDFYPFIQNVVHCPWANELDTDLGLLTKEEKEKIEKRIAA